MHVLTLGEFITERLKSLGLSEARAASGSHGKLSQTTLNELKSGRQKGHRASIATLLALAQILSVRPVEVFAAALGVPLSSIGVDDLLSDDVFQLRTASDEINTLWDGLDDRDRRVLVIVAQGLTDAGVTSASLSSIPLARSEEIAFRSEKSTKLKKQKKEAP